MWPLRLIVQYLNDFEIDRDVNYFFDVTCENKNGILRRIIALVSTKVQARGGTFFFLYSDKITT